MRYILLFLTIIIASCATNRIRYTRIKNQPTEIITGSNNSCHSSESDLSSYNERTVIENTMLQIDPFSVDEEPDGLFDQIEIRESTIEAETGQSTVDEIEDQEKLRAARYAEKLSLKARKNLLLSVIFLGISLIPFLGLLFILPSFILLLVGLIQFFVANRSRYNTPDGMQALKTSKILLIVWLVYLILVLTLIGLAFFLF